MTKSQRLWIAVAVLALLLLFAVGVGFAAHFKKTQYSAVPVTSFAAGNPCFTTYATVEAPKKVRLMAFSECTRYLDFFQRGGGVAPRQQVFALIGTPDQFLQLGDGQVVYLYWFRDAHGPVYCLLDFSADADDGRLTAVGYNREGGNDLSSWPPYVPPPSLPPPPPAASPSPPLPPSPAP